MRPAVVRLVRGNRETAQFARSFVKYFSADSHDKKSPKLQHYASEPRKGNHSYDLIDLEEGAMNIRAYGERVFQLNEVLVRQSVIVFSKSFLIWNARNFEDITVDNLLMIPLLFPTLEILIIGTGESMLRRLPVEFYDYFRSKGIAIEACATHHAAGVFNQLILEGRHVAAALLTMKPVIDEPDEA